MAKETVVIVGGGIAGLIAAKELSGHYHVIVLEASDRLGGRIYSYTGGGFTVPIDGGAEFIHGKTKHTIRLLKEAGISYSKLDGTMYRKENGQWQEQDDMIEHWDKLLKQMKHIEHDMTMHDFLQQYYGGDDYTAFREHVIAYTEGFDLADVKKVSVRSLYEEWSHEDEQYRVDGGYGRLVDYLANECIKQGCQIITNSIVKQIDWEANDVTVYTTDEQKYFGEKCVITIPISILQQDMGKMAINITPPLHDYIAAARNIGLGAVIKVVLQFREAFWKDDLGFVFSKELFPTWWTTPNTPILTGWAGGTAASQLSDDTDGALLEKALLSVATIFDISMTQLRQNLQAGKIFNWQKHGTALGGYCYATTETSTVRKLLNTPLLNTLFFAGEGLYDGPFPGTVEAAIISAQEAVNKLIK